MSTPQPPQQPGFPPVPPPTAYGHPATAQPVAPPPPAGKGIGVASLVLGIASIVLAIGLGFVLGIVAVILGIMSRKRPAAAGLGLGGIITGSIGILMSVVLTIAVAIPVALGIGEAMREAEEKASSIPVPGETSEEGTSASAGPQTITTPCYSFDGPAAWVNNIGADQVAACTTSLELWGEQEADGTIVETGVGSVWGGVTVQTVDSAFVTSIAPNGTMDEILAYLETDYWAANGEEVAQLVAPLELDGAEANATAIIPDTEYTTTRVYLSALPDAPYTLATGDAAFFLITVSTPYDDGEELINQVIDTWRWA